MVDSLCPMKVLSDGQVERIRKATEDVLEKTGFRLRHSGLLRQARKAGATVDETGGRLRIPAPLLRELLSQVPPQIDMRGILGDRWRLGGDQEDQHALAIVTDPWIIDYDSRLPRRPCLEDVRRHTIIGQKLDMVSSMSRMDFPVTDCPDATSSLRALEVHLLNHAKHYSVYAATIEGFEQWLRIGRILSGGGDLGGLISTAVAVLSPLVIDELNGQLLLRAVEEKLAIAPTVCPIAGHTGPYSLASTLLQCNVEALIVAALAQIVRPGTPFIYAVGPSVADMRTGNDLYYTLDKVLWKVAGVQLGRSYSLPVAAECGGSLTYRYDPQCGAEGMLFMLAAHASGAHLLSGIGSFHNAVGMSAEMMVMQEAFLNAARHLGRGIDTDDSHLGLGSIEQVGPGGSFLADELTIQVLRTSEFFRDEIFDSSGTCVGSKSMLERAHERVEELLSGYQSPVPEGVQEGLRRHFHDLYAAMGSQGGK